MAFFKNNTAGERNTRIARIEQMVWVLVYGGLLTAVLGYFMETSQGVNATDLYAIGTLAIAMGVALIFIRSRMSNDKDRANDKGAKP